MRAWRATNLPVTTDPAPKVTHPKLVATRAEVEQVVASKNALLLAARPLRFFSGKTRHAAARTPGTISGSKNIDNAVWFAPKSSVLLDAATVQKIAHDKGIDPQQPTISFCNTGHRAATNWFVLSEVLGIPNVKLYIRSRWSAGRATADRWRTFRRGCTSSGCS